MNEDFQKKLDEYKKSRPHLNPEQRKKLHDLLFEMPSGVELMVLSSLIESVFEWRKWQQEIPYIPFKPEWEVQVIPPFAGAIVRFWVRKKDNLPEHHVSVYLDCYDVLGYFGAPYWEIYDGSETSRVPLNAVDALLDEIEKGLKQ